MTGRSSNASPRWDSRDPDMEIEIGFPVLVRAVARSFILFAIILLGLAFLLPLRSVEVLVHGAGRPWTSWIVHLTSRLCRTALGLRVDRLGSILDHGRVALVANHVSWVDILVLNGEARMTFVAKAEVRRWPGIGLLARAAGTIFIERDPRKVAQQSDLLAMRVAQGHRLLVFAEGTSTDGLRVLPFRPSLFSSFIKSAPMSVQPLALTYLAPRNADPRFYGWWGKMSFGPHFLSILGALRQGRVSVTFGEPVDVSHHSNRKTIAALVEDRVRHGFETARCG